MTYMLRGQCIHMLSHIAIEGLQSGGREAGKGLQNRLAF